MLRSIKRSRTHEERNGEALFASTSVIAFVVTLLYLKISYGSGAINEVTIESTDYVTISILMISGL
jgi:hypothetical protein